LISSSRPGGLPANLQGVWNELTKPAWRGDYHSNINIQMNYLARRVDQPFGVPCATASISSPLRHRSIARTC
jgi:hypothetical protein